MDTTSARTLSERTHWDSVHAAEAHQWTSAIASRTAVSQSSTLKSRLKRLLGSKFIESLSAYDDYVLWNDLLPRYFEGLEGAQVVEIGSAPGEFLTTLKDRFDVVPFGIEYSESGAELNRRIFAQHGVDPANVIEQDFFQVCNEDRYQGRFDAVISRGFIEHFENVDDVVNGHLRLLRSGGLLFLTIPNLRGFNRALCSVFCPELVPMHNLEIMTRAKLRALVSPDAAEIVFCDYRGTFNFCLCSARPDSPLRFLYAAGVKAQVALNFIFRLLFGKRGVDSAWFSPSIVLVAIKR